MTSAPTNCDSAIEPSSQDAQSAMVMKKSDVDSLSMPALRAAATIFIHFVVDVFSFVGVALLPLLAVMLDLRTEQKALLLALGSLCSGAVQPLVAWASDRYDSRAFGTVGFVVAILCISNLGMARNFTELTLLYCVGAMGIGAFHPPAAATVGHLGGSKRSMYIALFFLAGMLGGVVGNVFTPKYVAMMTPMIDQVPDTTAGLRSLLWFIPIGLVCALFLAFAIHKVGHRHDHANHHHVSWDRAERRQRWFALWVLYIANMLRFSVNMALIYLLVEWTGQVVLRENNAVLMNEELGIEASQLNGILQASMQVGMGGAGILLGILLSARFEKFMFVVLPMLGSLALFMIPRTEMISESAVVPFAIFATILTGVGFGAVIPVSISLAQRLLPHRTSLASGLMLGGAWMLAFVGPLFAELVHKGLATKPNTPDWVMSFVESLPEPISSPLIEGMGLAAGFSATAIVLFGAGLIALLLPHKLIVRVAKH
jgi:MFS family permease